MPIRPWLPALTLVLAASATPVALACGSDDEAQQVTAPGAGDPAAGRDAIAELGCGRCHAIPGVRGADGRVGPPLDDWSGRAYIAGTLRNTPENLERWILDPRDVKPDTPMPDVGATEQQARDVAAHLFTLGG